MFAVSEYRQRLARLQQEVAAAELDAFLVRTDPNIMYLNGVDFYSAERKVLMIVPAQGAPALLVPRMETERLSRSAVADQILTYWEMDARPGRGWVELLHQALKGMRRIGLEPFAEADIIPELVGYDWRVAPLVENLRVIKSPAEVALLRRAAGYFTEAMHAMLRELRAGTLVPELMRIGGRVADQIFAAEPHADHFNTQCTMIYQVPPDSGSPHHFSMRADQRLPSGPTIINAVGRVTWYYAENERTILAGEYTPQQAELFDFAQRGQQLALDLIRPGVPCAEVDHAVQAFFEQAGVAACLRHRTGHGLGVVGHERPYTSEGSPEVYQPNMVISVEPGLYLEGVGGFRHCDTVRITEDGIEVFTLGAPKLRQQMTFS